MCDIQQALQSCYLNRPPEIDHHVDFSHYSPLLNQTLPSTWADCSDWAAISAIKWKKSRGGKYFKVETVFAPNNVIEILDENVSNKETLNGDMKWKVWSNVFLYIYQSGLFNSGVLPIAHFHTNKCF